MANDHPARFTLAWWIASGFGGGVSPLAPGTVGSLVGLAIGLPLLHVSAALVMLAIGLACLAGIWAIQATTGQSLLGQTKAAHDDPGWIVIDEIAGQLIAMLALHRISLPGAALAFALFRLFDITKPGPIGWADRKGGAVGIMLDDILAGLAAAVLLLAVQKLVPL